MSARGSKGKAVKTFTEKVPQSNLTTIDVVMTVYFKADTGEFRIFYPEHIAATLGDDMAHADTLAGALETWAAGVERYRSVLKSEQRKKVIMFTLKYNIQQRGVFQTYNAPTSLGSGISAPALNLTYEIFWDVNGVLYYFRGDEPGSAMQRYGVASGRRSIPWTAEREAFFASMKGALEGLILKLIDFDKAMSDDVDGAMVAFAQGRNLLSAPAKVGT